MFDSIKPAQDIQEFHQKVSENKGKIRYTDYEMIQNIRKQDIPEMKRILKDNIAYNKTLKKPNGEEFTQEDMNAKNKEWQDYLDSVNALEQSWQKGTLEIENHQEERYAETKSRTQVKLKELFGEVQKTASLQAPAQAPAQATTPASNIPANISEGEKLGLEQKLQNIQGKLDKYAKLKGLQSIVINKIAGNSSNGGIDSLTVTVTEQVQPPRINGKVYSFDGILLKGSKVLIHMKTDDELVKEIIQKIEGGDTTQENTQTIDGSESTPPIEITQPPVRSNRIERRELNDEEVLERNKRYIKEHNIGSKTADGVTDETLEGYLVDPTRKNIKDLQKIIPYPRTPDGIMGPITKKAILDYLGKKEPGKDQNESLPNSNQIGFTREGGRIVLNARDTAGNIIQKLSYEDIMKLSGKEGKLSEVQRGELNKLILLSTIGDIWIQAASKNMDNMMFGSFRSGGKEEYKKQIQSIRDYIGDLQGRFKDGKPIGSDMTNFYRKFDSANSATGGLTPPIAINDLRKALDIVQSVGSLDTRRASILKTLSSKFDATTTEAVKSTAMVEVLRMDDFKDLRTKFADPKFMLEFLSGDSKKWLPILQSNFGLSENDAYSLARDLRDTRKGMEGRTDEIRSALTEKGVPTDKIEEQIKGAKNMSLQMVMSKYIIDSKINSLSGGFVDAYKQSKSDLTWNKAIDISVQLAISLVPMGGGLLAVRGAAAIGARLLPKIATGAGKLATGARIAGEGVAFYEGFNLTNNLIHNQDTDNKFGGLVEGALDVKEIVKSIAMVGVIRGLGMIPGQRIDAMLLKDPTKMKQFALEAGKVAGISLAVMGTSQGVEAMFGEGFHPTPEEFVQAVIMTALFRKFGGKKIGDKAEKNQYEYDTIESRKGINIVRKLQKQNPSYKPEIVGPKGEVLMIEGIRGRSGSEKLQTSNKVTGEKGEITVSEFTSGKYKRLNTSSTNGEPISKSTEEDTISSKKENTKVSAKDGGKNTDSSNKKWETPKIGSKLEKSPSSILKDVSKKNLGKNEKAFVKEMEGAIKDIETMDVKALKMAREKINDLGGELSIEGKIKENSPTIKAWENLLENIDIRIGLKSPKQHFSSMKSAKEWINENKGKVGTGVAIAVAGTIYLTRKTKDGNIEIRIAPAVGETTIAPAPAVGETTIASPTVSVASITPPK